MSARNTTRRSGLLLLAMLGVLAALLGTTADAFAGTGYVPAGVFGSEGSGQGQFDEPGGVAVDQSSGDVYVYDAGNRRVERFNSSGSKLEGQFDGSAAPTGQFAPPAKLSEYAAHGTLFNLAIDNDPSSPSAGDVYVVDPGHNVIDKFSATGVYLSQLTGFQLPIFGVAVDTDGNVWVAEEGEEEGGNNLGPIQEFDGSLVNIRLPEVRPEKKRSPGIAVDSEQNLYLLKGEPDAVEFTHKGAFIGESFTFCTCDTALAVNQGTNELIIDQGSAIARFGPFGVSAQETLGGIASSQGLAVNGTTNTMYATQRQADTVAIFDLVPLPEVVTGSAGDVQRTSAKLEGEVNPGGEEVTSCEFEYGTGTSYGHTAPCEQTAGAGTSSVVVSAEVTSLAVQTIYHYRLVVHNTHGSRAGADREFPTPAAVEGLLTGEASEVHATTATLGGSLEPNGDDTHYFFEYGLGESYGSTTASVDAGSGSGAKAVSTEVDAFEPNQIYHFRIVAENTLGRTVGDDAAFRTALLPALIVGAPNASFLSAQSAVLNASLNPEHAATHYYFEYGPCSTLAGCSTTERTTGEVSSVYGTIGTSQEITGLASSTTYSYRLVASNRYIASCEGGNPVEEEGSVVRCEGGVPIFEGGEATGAEGTFMTGPAALLTATTGPASAITPTSAIVAGTVDPDGQQATYVFELGVYEGAATQYGVVFSGPAGSSVTPIEETLPLSGLQPGSVYAYRVTIRSGYGEATGATATLTTPGLPAVLAPAAPLPLLATPGIAFPRATSVATSTKTKTKTQSRRAQKRIAALKECKKRSKARRARCERAVGKQFGSVPATKR